MLKFYYAQKKMWQMLINIVFIIQIILFIIIFLVTLYWFLDLIDKQFLTFINPLANFVSGLVKIFYRRMIEVGGVKIDGSILLFDIFALLPTLPDMASIQSQHGLRSQNANRMLTLFRKICFDGKNPKSLVPTMKTPETPVKSRVSGVLKGAEKRSKCFKRHPLPTTRNQFGSNPTWVRIPPAAPRRSKVRFAPTSFYAYGKKDVIRPLPCSSFPTATHFVGLAVGVPPCGRHFSLY